MNTPWILTAFAVGGLLGAFYFGGLWFTVRRLSSSRQPALLLLVSIIARMSVVVFGIYAVSGGRWEPIVACMFGFLIARVLLTRCLGDVSRCTAQPSSLSTKETT